MSTTTQERDCGYTITDMVADKFNNHVGYPDMMYFDVSTLNFNVYGRENKRNFFGEVTETVTITITLSDESTIPF